MQRYFISKESISHGVAVLDGNDFHHLSRVMRMKPGDEVLLSDGEGHSYLGQIDRFEEAEVFVRIVREATGHPALPVTIAQGLIKKDAFELMVEKATEFGAGAIIPTIFSRSIVKIEDEETGKKKTERYQKIAKEAAEQCHRAMMPRISLPMTLKEIPYENFDHVWVAYESSGPEETLNAAVSMASPDDEILVLIGPEGGIAPEELKLLKTKGARVIDLGPRILRSETAALYLLSVLSHRWGR